MKTKTKKRESVYNNIIGLTDKTIDERLFTNRSSLERRTIFETKLLWGNL